SGFETSITCNNKSASVTSSKVDLNAAINDVGSSCKNPTVSINKHSKPDGKCSLRDNGSSVANNRFSSKLFSLFKRLNNVDFPALVYHIIAIWNRWVYFL